MRTYPIARLLLLTLAIFSTLIGPPPAHAADGPSPWAASKGLEALVEVTEEMSGSGQALRLCAPNKTVREVLELTDLASMFDHFEDTNTAVRSFL